MKKETLKTGTLVLFNETIFTINGYDAEAKQYYLGTDTENRHLEPETAFTVIRLGDKLLM